LALWSERGLPARRCAGFQPALRKSVEGDLPEDPFDAIGAPGETPALHSIRGPIPIRLPR
jgi:hypothetical protein